MNEGHLIAKLSRMFPGLQVTPRITYKPPLGACQHCRRSTPYVDSAGNRLCVECRGT